MDVVLANAAPGILSRVAGNPYAQRAAFDALVKAGSYAAKYYSGGGGRVLKYSPAYKHKSMVHRPKRGRLTRKAPGGAGSYRQSTYRKRRKVYRKKAKARRVKGPRKLTQTVNRLSKQVKNLQYAENASLGDFTHRHLYTTSSITSVDGKSYGVAYTDGLSMAHMASTAALLKYYNPATPGTLTTANFETGTYDRRLLFKSCYSAMECRNNYQTDVKIKVYLCFPKQSSSISPTTAWQNGINANGDASLTDYKQIGQYPNDYSDFKDVWSAKLHCQATLSPGQTMTCSHSSKNIEFDPTAYDQHTASYQSKYKNFSWMIVTEGTIGHVGTTIGLGQAGVDIKMMRIRRVQYDAGVNLKYSYVQNDLGTSTTSTVQSHQPVSDNIAYSAS